MTDQKRNHKERAKSWVPQTLCGQPIAITPAHLAARPELRDMPGLYTVGCDPAEPTTCKSCLRIMDREAAR